MLKDWKSITFPLPYNNTKDVTDLRQRYSAEVYNIDRWIKIYMEELKKRNELDNTIFVFCSDHGDMLGDHGVTGKDKPFYASAGVPMIFSGPGIAKGIVNHQPATSLDLTATFLDFAGVKITGRMDSKSLKTYLANGKNYQRKFVTSSLGSWRLAFDGRYKLVDHQNGKFELYDLKTDPAETINFAGQYPKIVKRLKRVLPGWFPKNEVRSR